MVSHTPFADPSTFSLRRHLAETTIGPAEMFDLALICFAKPTTVNVLCKHAKGSFRLLVGLYAALEHFMTETGSSRDHDWFRDRVGPYVVDQVRNASESDLLDGLRTARTVFTGGRTRTFRDGPLYISCLFAAHAPHGSLTDPVAAEMSVRSTCGLSPQFGLETQTRQSVLTCAPVSRLLLSRFGTHAPSWDMFKHAHSPETRVGDVADLVTEVEQNR